MSKIINFEEEKKKRINKKLIINIIFIIVLIYIVYAVYLIIRTPTDTVTVEKGTLTMEESSTGYIIRNETIVKGENYKNGIYPIIQERERAAKNQTIFRYYGKNEQDLQAKIEEIDAKIQEAMEKENAIPPSDIKTLEEQIDAKTYNLRNLTDRQAIQEIKKEVSEIILKKAIIAGEQSPKGTYIKKLVSQREKYEKELTETSEYILAPESGIVSYRVDNLENVLTTKDFSNLTEKKLEELNVKTGKIIPENEECAKVIKDFGCYIAVVLKSDAAKNASEGDVVKITLSSGDEVDATVNYIKDEENGEKLIVFKVKTLTEELIAYRKISFNITWWSYTGVKVPNDSILEEENLKYVIKKTTTGTKKVLIKVLKTNGDYSIINTYSSEDLVALGIDISDYGSIDVYDTIVLYPE